MAEVRPGGAVPSAVAPRRWRECLRCWRECLLSRPACAHDHRTHPERCNVDLSTAVHCPTTDRLCIIVTEQLPDGRRANDVATDRAAAAPLGLRTDRSVRHHRKTRRRGDGAGVPRPVHGRAPGGGEDDPGRTGRGARLPRQVRPRGGGGQPGERRVHRRGHRGGPGRRPALGRDRVRARARR